MTLHLSRGQATPVSMRIFHEVSSYDLSCLSIAFDLGLCLDLFWLHVPDSCPVTRHVLTAFHRVRAFHARPVTHPTGIETYAAQVLRGVTVRAEKQITTVIAVLAYVIVVKTPENAPFSIVRDGQLILHSQACFYFVQLISCSLPFKLGCACMHSLE